MNLYFLVTPINRFCFDNAVLDTDRIENCKPVKRAANMVMTPSMRPDWVRITYLSP